MMTSMDPERVRGNNIRAWKGHGSVPPVTVTNIISFDRTRVVMRPIYDLVIILGKY